MPQYYLLIGLLLIFSCQKEDHKINFTFLQLNDVYEIAPIQGGQFGGLARVATVHQDLVKENKNTFLFMAGDFLNPSLLGTLTYGNERVRGKQMIEVMNAMHFDVVSFGNHEFDLKQAELQQRINESTFDWIAGNVSLSAKGSTMPFYKEVNHLKTALPKTIIKTFSDEDGTTVKIGFISVCLPSNPKDYVSYANMLVSIKQDYNALKDQVDLVFGLTHAKLATDKKIAQLLPNLPLIMGGHEHSHSQTMIGNVQISKADANAKTVYIHKISFDKKTKQTVVSSQLKTINATIIADEKVGAVVDKWQRILKTQLKTIVKNPEAVIYNAKIPLDGRDTPIRSTQTNLGQLITQSMAFAYDYKVDGALVNGGSIRIDDALEGAINAVDIFRVLPYGGAVLKVQLKGSVLLRVLNYGEQAAGTGAYLHRYQLAKVGGQWLVGGKTIEKQQTYTIAFSEYLLKGFDIPFLTPKYQGVQAVYVPNENDLAFDIRKAIIHYLTNF